MGKKQISLMFKSSSVIMYILGHLKLNLFLIKSVPDMCSLFHFLSQVVNALAQ